MDHIDETLATQSQDVNLEPAIHAAISFAKKTLNSYYDKTDHSEVYRIAMGMYSVCLCIYAKHLPVLHPRHKLKYFEKVGWERDWITTAEAIVRAEFERSYAETHNNTPASEVPLSSRNKKVNVFGLFEFLAITDY